MRPRNRVGNDFEIEVREEVEGEDPVGTIMSQDPAGGMAEKGSIISVTAVGTEVADVPNVVNQSRDAAREALENEGFGVAERERESSFDDEGLVIAQDPKGGSSAETGSEVTITVGTGPSTVEVPSVYGITQDQAAGVLEGVGLEARHGESGLYKRGFRGPDLLPGARPRGRASSAAARCPSRSASGRRRSEVTEVYGLDIATAQANMEELGLVPTAIESTLPNDEPAGTALETDPAMGTLLDPGSPITIYYSAGPPPETDPGLPAGRGSSRR